MVIKKALILLALIFLIACTPKVPQVEIGDAIVIVELAITPEEQAKGLMHRTHLGENKGMLFIFEKEKPLSFWMKNTFIPLDMIFINSENKIVDFKKAKPCQGENCKQYTSKDDAKYVLEVNAGFAEQHKVSVGDEIKMNV